MVQRWPPPLPPPPMGMGGQYRLVLLVPPLWPVVVVWFFWSPPCGLWWWYVGMLVCMYVCNVMYVCMYVCIYTTTGASYPPHPMGGGGNTGHGTIYRHDNDRPFRIETFLSAERSMDAIKRKNSKKKVTHLQ